jgi:hypothetical protein
MAGAAQSPGNAVKTRLGWVPAVALLVAAAHGVALVVAAFVAPVYGTDSSSSSGESSQGSDTLVGVNGLSAAAVLAVPLLVTLAVGCALWLRPHRWALPVAWTLTGLLAAGNLLAMLSVGIFVLPLTTALVLACARSRPAARPPAVFHPPQWAGS